MDKIFEPILDADEKVIKVFKPHKGKMFTSVLFISFCCWCWFLIVAAIGMLTDPETGEFTPVEWWIVLGICLGIVIFFTGITALFTALAYRNTYYAYTNKRVIIRKGVLGVDYKSLDMSMIGAIDVSVSVIDKIICKNTGSISYGSMASPIAGQNGVMFKFSHIRAPYETYKEIKTVIDEFKNSKKEK